MKNTKRPLGLTGMSISPVIFGGIVVCDETPEEAAEHVAYAVEQGVNYFDVAPSYGDAEVKLGPALEPFRKDVYLACKTQQRDAVNAQKEFENSLKTLRTEYFDTYQLHAMSSHDDVRAVFAADGAMSYLLKMKEKGYIKHLGITAHNEDTAIEALAYYPFESVLFPVNWALGIKSGFGERLAELCAHKSIGFLSIKALAHRQWFEGEGSRFPKSWCKTIYDNYPLAIAAIKYTLSKGALAIDPPGNFEQFKFTVEHIDECIDNPLTDADLELLKREFELVKDFMIF
jgi:aryl-alcohol dehydrogenase-like predicted oxidoreductase